jgi:hypothetical protein
MAATYPGGSKSFTTKSDGAGNTILAAHINDLQEEVTAIEQDLIAGLPQSRGGTGTTDAGQFPFPAAQNASTDVNTLDDYEEGTWTPAIGGSGGQSGQAYTIQQGSYIKIGKLVHAQFTITLSTLGTVTGNAEIQGLPFASQNTTNQNASASIGQFTGMTTSIVFLGAVNVPNTQTMPLRMLTAAATGISVVAQADLSNTTSIIGAISYRASA